MTCPKSHSQKVAASGFKLTPLWLQGQCYFPLKQWFPQWSVQIMITWKICSKIAGFHPQFWDEAWEFWQVAKWSWWSGCAGPTLRTAGLNPDELRVHNLGQVGQPSCSLSLHWTWKYANLLEKAPSSSRASPCASCLGTGGLWPPTIKHWGYSPTSARPLCWCEQAPFNHG